MVKPKSGARFGCSKRFQVHNMASSQKACGRLSATAHREWGEMGAQTLVNDGKNFLWVTHMLLTRTLEPLSFAWNTLLLSFMSVSESTIQGQLIFSNPDSGEGVYDIGSTPLEPHIPLSADRQFLEASLEGSRPSRTYPGLKGEC